MGPYKVGFSRLARRDIKRIVRYIAEDDPAAAERLGLKLVTRALKLADSVLALAGSNLRNSNGARKLIEGNYLIIYDVFPESGKVRVLRFWHSAQKPERMNLGR
jgi:plasmid stabilization system protein ParE